MNDTNPPTHDESNDDVIDLTPDDLVAPPPPPPEDAPSGGGSAGGGSAGGASREGAPSAGATDSDRGRATQPTAPPSPPRYHEQIDLVESDRDEAAPIRPMHYVRESKYKWKRPPNRDGTGATHVKTFIAKLRADAMAGLDDQINQWLDEHPQVEVKFVTTAIGPLKGKETEDALFVNLWL